MKDYKLKGYSTWKDVMNNKSIFEIQDPILEMEIDKCEFEEMYPEIISELEGQDEVLESYIDYYFIINPMKSYALSFRGEKEKREFYDIGVKKNSVLSLTEVHEGETKKEKNKRNKKKQVKEVEDDYIIIFE